MNHGKHYVDSAKLIDRTKTYEPQEALELCCKTAKAKFDETVELHVRLGVDSRHADQQVRGAVVLPNGTGKNVRVVAICKGDAAKAAEAASDYYNSKAAPAPDYYNSKAAPASRPDYYKNPNPAAAPPPPARVVP